MAGSPVAALRAVSQTLDRRVAATPAGRDRTVDLMRAVSIAVVVIWHWAGSVTHRRGTPVRGTLMTRPAAPLGWPGPPRVGGAAGRSQMCSPTAPAPSLNTDPGSGFRGFNCLYRLRRDPRRWTRTRAGCRRRPQTRETLETVRQPPITMIKAAATQMDSHVLVTSGGRRGG